MPTTSLAVRGSQCLIVCAALVAALFLSTGPAQARATVDTFSFTETDTYTAPLEGCLPQDLVGTVTLTVTVTGQEVDRAQGGGAVHGVNTYDYRLDLPGGMYVQSGLSQEHFTFDVNPPLTVFNGVTQDIRTIYAADGTPVGSLSIHEVAHITWADRNGNSTPDPGEISVTFDHFRLRCG